MCGRYSRRGDKQKIAESFHVSTGLDEVYESDDCAPGSCQPALRINEEGQREFIQMRWGFKLPDRLLFNTRAEGAATSRFWKKMLTGHRCIVPASSFFEWKPITKIRKDKYEITVLDSEIFGMAALWSPWMNAKTCEWENTFSIITTEPNPNMEQFHDRQPLILAPTEFAEWLEPVDRPPLQLMRILPAERMNIRLISPPSRRGAKVEAQELPGLFD